MSAVGIIAAGSAGSSLVNLAFAPLFAANQYIGSYFFGSGMILGERDMYQEDWPKIKARLDKGESFISILEEQTTRNTTAIMSNAKDIVIQVSSQWNKIVFDYLQAMPQSLLDLIGIKLPGADGSPPPVSIPDELTDEQRQQLQGSRILTQRQVLDLSITQLKLAVEHDLATYDTATQRLLLAQYNRKDFDAIEDARRDKERQDAREKLRQGEEERRQVREEFTPVDNRRKAGQSQKLERLKLLDELRTVNRKLADAPLLSKETPTQKKHRIAWLQEQQRINKAIKTLNERYIF